MIGLVVRRLGWTVVVAWFVVTATFALISVIPADPVRALAPHATPEVAERIRAHYCLDRSFTGQYGCFVSHVARGELGESVRGGRPVTQILAERAWPSIQLALAAIVLQLVFGALVGVVGAARRGRWADRVGGLAGVVGLSAPPFFVGPLLLFLLAYRLGWFPLGGYGSGVLDRLWHLVLPAATIACGGLAYYARAVRTEMIDALGQDYVRTARAKGLPERSVIVRHALRNSLGPLTSIAGLSFGMLLCGEVIVEYIFAWPGLGRELLLAILAQDGPVIVGIVLVSALALACANLVVDLVQLWLDPRLRAESE
ncbi:MAG TPA: ABC transporter permease [Kofleriaceae bacterium]|jgi:ABC-type dipeptide/oligopeptide/nickel transport system permease component